MELSFIKLDLCDEKCFLKKMLSEKNPKGGKDPRQRRAF